MTREELNLIFIYFLNYTFLLLIFQIYHNSYQYNETYELLIFQIYHNSYQYNETYELLIFQIYHNSYQYNETYELTHFTQRCDIQITSNYVRDFLRLKIENMGVNEYIIKT